MPTYKLTYFDTQGYAEGIRYLFALAGVPFEDVRIPIAADRSLPQEIKDKCPWGQVPILDVDGKIIAQSSAIFRYVARELGFAGKNNFEAAKCDEYVDAARDFIEEIRPVLREKDEAKKEELKKNLDDVIAPKFFERFTKILKENGNWLVGNSITWADLGLANFIELYMTMLATRDVLSDFPVIKEYFLRILALPEVKKFRQENPPNDPLLKRKY